jgi:alcohol dehydrogenase
MKAAVYTGPGRPSWDDVPKPTVLEPNDAVVRVDAVTICGTDLHILKGDVPTVDRGRVLGHEAVGTIEEVGSSVTRRRVGDRVLVSCISSCGACRFCRAGQYGQCLGGGGWILGHRIDGTQAEYVRVPFADTSTYAIPDGVTDEQMLMLADIGPTGYEVGVLNGQVEPADVVVVVGAGPVGLSAIMGARLFSPVHIVAIDRAESRLLAAKAAGADVTTSASGADAIALVQDLTDGLGADVAIEAVGVSGDLRALHRHRPARWARGQRRRPRCPGDAAPRGPVDPQRHYHDGPRGHLLDADAHPASSRAASSTWLRSSPIGSPWTTCCRRTRCSPTQGTPVPSRSSSPGRRRS